MVRFKHNSRSNKNAIERERDKDRPQRRWTTQRSEFDERKRQVHFVREISRMSRCSVIRTDETTISDDARDVMTRPLPRTDIFPFGIYRGEYMEGNF